MLEFSRAPVFIVRDIEKCVEAGAVNVRLILLVIWRGVDWYWERYEIIDQSISNSDLLNSVFKFRSIFGFAFVLLWSDFGHFWIACGRIATVSKLLVLLTTWVLQLLKLSYYVQKVTIPLVFIQFFLCRKTTGTLVCSASAAACNRCL